MRVRVSTTLACTADKAWEQVLTPALLRRVAAPMAVIRPSRAAAFPARWEVGSESFCKSYLFGIIPVGERRLAVERVDAERRQIQFREQDRLVRRWDHLIKIEPADGGAVYTDEIDIDAGVLTLPVWAWASLFYRHRQRRWRALAKDLT